MMLKLLSYNIHKGFTIGNTKYVLNQMRDALRTIPVDIVFLQEVSGQHPVSKKGAKSAEVKESQLEYLAHQVWPHHVYGKNAVYGGRDHGNAILSQYPILEHENVDISTNPMERRGLQHVVIKVPDLEQPLHCLNVHLNLLHSGRLKQVKKLCDRISSLVPAESPLILAGDFNDWSKRISTELHKQARLVELNKTVRGQYPKTFPSRFPLFPLDRIYIRGFASRRAEIMNGRPWNILSDHIPIFGEVAFGDSETK